MFEKRVDNFKQTSYNVIKEKQNTNAARKPLIAVVRTRRAGETRRKPKTNERRFYYDVQEHS